MFLELWRVILYVPILNVLVFFYHLLFENLGLAIIAMTFFLKIILYPLTKPSIEAAKKQKELQPQLQKLKKKYKNKQVLAQKQMELYKQHGVNPMSGCLPQILQLVIIIALYRVFTNLLMGNGVMISEMNELLYNVDFLKFASDAELNTQFLYLNLSKVDQAFILPVLAAVAQFFTSKYMAGVSGNMKKVVSDTPDKSDDVMYNMQKQMMYMMPIMTLVIGIKLPSGLVLYWLVSNLLSLVQYLILNQKWNLKIWKR